MRNSISVDKIIVNKNRVDYFFTVTGNLQKYFKNNNHLFLQYNHDISDVPHSILAIPVVSNIIPLIWLTDSTLYMNELDKSYYQCLDELRAAFRKMYPNVTFGGATQVKAIVENRYTPEIKAASLFSGGLDALTTFIRIKDINPMLITEYGWHQDEIKYSEVWEADKANAINIAKRHGLQNILIESNFADFILSDHIDRDFGKKLENTWWQGLHHGLAFISSAIPIAFKFKVECIYIASSLHIGHIAKCGSDPTVDSKIRYASGKAYHDAYELTRQDKVKLVVDYYSRTSEPVNIRVCFKNERNCCKCEKCIRTILGIVAEGRNPRDYGFDIPNDLSKHVKEFLDENVKYLPPDLILMVWNIIKKRMAENKSNVLYKDLLEWFINYDFAAQQKKSLLQYRITNFFPIVKRKISERLINLFTQKA